jgi:ubiquinone/menaquinone biosynthesis C-methylase UbiE
MHSIEQRLIRVEQQRHIIEPWSILSRRFTVSENKQLWNTYDWTMLGEEWTCNTEWKDQIIHNFLITNVIEGGTVVEIGPGGGRWTEILRSRAKELYVIDVSEVALKLCRQRFAASQNINYLIGDGRTIDLPDTSVDAIWSYDVFVHVNPLDARSYFQEFARVLKPGVRAVIHHPGPPNPNGKERRGWRSDLTDRMVLDFAQENNLQVVEQISRYVNKGDVLTIAEKAPLSI